MLKVSLTLCTRPQPPVGLDQNVERRDSYGIEKYINVKEQLIDGTGGLG